jgi:PilZ domain
VTFERRQSPRLHTSAPVWIAGAPARMIDLSASGVCFESIQRFNCGEYVPMELPLPDDDNPDFRVWCDGRVVRIEQRAGTFMVAATYEVLPPKSRSLGGEAIVTRILR